MTTRTVAIPILGIAVLPLLRATMLLAAAVLLAAPRVQAQ